MRIQVTEQTFFAAINMYLYMLQNDAFPLLKQCVNILVMFVVITEFPFSE